MTERKLLLCSYSCRFDQHFIQLFTFSFILFIALTKKITVYCYYFSVLEKNFSEVIDSKAQIILD